MKDQIATTKTEKLSRTFLSEVKEKCPLGDFEITETGKLFENDKLVEVTIRATVFGWAWYAEFKKLKGEV